MFVLILNIIGEINEDKIAKSIQIDAIYETITYLVGSNFARQSRLLNQQNHDVLTS